MIELRYHSLCNLYFILVCAGISSRLQPWDCHYEFHQNASMVGEQCGLSRRSPSRLRTFERLSQTANSQDL